jgi:hypothetical protein
VHSSEQPKSSNVQDVSPSQQRPNDGDEQYLPLVSPAMATSKREMEGGPVGRTNRPLRSDRPTDRPTGPFFSYFFNFDQSCQREESSGNTRPLQRLTVLPMPRSNGSWLRVGDSSRCKLTIWDKLQQAKHHHSGDGLGL